MQGQIYQVKDMAAIDKLKSRLSEAFEGLHITETNTTFEVYDSFDWRLYHKGWQLTRHNHHYVINACANGQTICDVMVDAKTPKQFWWDFPESDFSRCLAAVVDMRALMSVAVIDKQSTLLNVCNADDKTVVRLEWEAFKRDAGDPPITRCRLLPVRGYEKAARRVQALFKEMQLPPAKGSPVIAILEQRGAAPGEYSSKIKVVLEPEVPAAEAVRQVMEDLVTTMHVNLPGVRQDIDTEFLHDFRVSVRRARSLLGQIKTVLDAETTSSLRAQLKAMGAITGNVRDLDVYLLKKTEYSERVPDFLKPGILQLFRTLQRKRRYAKDRMVKEMSGSDFDATLGNLDTFVESDPQNEAAGPIGNHPIKDVAKAAIYKRYRRVVKKGRRITEETPDTKLHELRIDCKKLRYLLEFFSSLFPSSQMKTLIKQLKQLQENLGDFNDLCVQQDFLIQHLSSIKPQTAQVVMLSAAVGGLVSRLFADHQAVREQFLAVFEKFNAPENQKRFKTLFA
jgi:CHAD domain-containing protein